ARTSADTDIRLTEWTACGGCAAKWGASPLAALVRDLSSSADPALLVGLAPFDDAAVYRVSDDLAVVATTDFFPPLVDDPADFGAVAAANACSDVFAMGARGASALNISAFPAPMPAEAVGAILTAAAALHGPDEPPHAVTDVTGFGLLGHAWEVAERSGVTIELDADALPLYRGALAAAEAGVRTGGDARNRAHLEGRVTCAAPA